MPIAPIDQKNGEQRAKKLSRKQGVKKRGRSCPAPCQQTQRRPVTQPPRAGTGIPAGLAVTNESLPDDAALLRQQTQIPQNPSDLSGLITGK
jgi:hypothetical protein